MDELMLKDAFNLHITTHPRNLSRGANAQRVAEWDADSGSRSGCEDTGEPSAGPHRGGCPVRSDHEGVAAGGFVGANSLIQKMLTNHHQAISQVGDNLVVSAAIPGRRCHRGG